MTEFPEGRAALRAEIARLREMLGGSDDATLRDATNELIAELERRAGKCGDGGAIWIAASVAGPPETTVHAAVE